MWAIATSLAELPNLAENPPFRSSAHVMGHVMVEVPAVVLCFLSSRTGVGSPAGSAMSHGPAPLEWFEVHHGLKECNLGASSPKE